MVWSPVSPDGTISVRANTPNMLANTVYTETTLNNDHYWNFDELHDGRHKQVGMYATVGDAPLIGGIDGVTYLRAVSGSNARIQGFYQNGQGIYQYIPTFRQGTVNLPNTSNFFVVTSIEPESYGQVFMWQANALNNMTMGYFKATSGILHCYSCVTEFSGTNSVKNNLKFGNNADAVGLDIRVQVQDGNTGMYQFRVISWGI